MENPRRDVDRLEAECQNIRANLEAARSACPQLKIWVLTWNLGAAEPFAASKGKAPKHLGQFVPPGYDLYVVGVQEACSDEVFDAFEQRLSMQEGISRVDLAGFAVEQAAAAAAAAAAASSQGGSESSSSNVGGGSGNRPDYIYGRGDGSMLHPKFTGIALFARDSLVACGRIKVLRAAYQSTALMTSKGGAACCLSLDGQTVAFISCHLEAGNKFEERRSQYREVSFGLGGKLGEGDFDLGTQLHHIVWIGDMNYRCVQGAGRGERDKAMDADRCVGLLENGRHQILFRNHDQLSIEIGRREVFYEYEEPDMAPDFYPTYKKFEQRPATNYLDKGWVKRTYHVHFREPIYKGGRVKDRTPGWCDRVLFHSLHDLRDELRPERVLLSSLPSSGGAAGVVKAPTVNHDTGELVDEQATLGDHYYAVNDGHGMSVSDHSPVVAAFTFSANWRRRRAAEAAAAAATPPAPLPGGNGNGSSHGEDDEDGPSDPAAFRGRAWEAHAGQVAALASPSSSSSSSSSSAPLLSASRPAPPPLPPRSQSSGDGSDGGCSVASSIGQCRVRLDGLELLVGTSTAAPALLKVLFPLPFESSWTPESSSSSPPSSSSSSSAPAAASFSPLSSSPVQVYADSEIAFAVPLGSTASDASSSSSSSSSAGGFWGSASATGAAAATLVAGSSERGSTEGRGSSHARHTSSSSSSSTSTVASGVRGLFKSSTSSGGSSGSSSSSSRNSDQQEGSGGTADDGGKRLTPPPVGGGSSMDVMWNSTPNSTGGVTCTVEIPDPEQFEVISMGQLHTSGGGEAAGRSSRSSSNSSTNKARAGSGSGAQAAATTRSSAAAVPWLQLEYEGPRSVDELHVAVQAHLGGGAGGGGGEFGHCVVGLSQLFEERERRRSEREERKRVRKQQRSEAEAAAAAGGGEKGEEEAERGDAEEAERERRGLIKSRFVKPLMFRGLPLLALDSASGEHEVVTAVFELSLHDDGVPIPVAPPSPGAQVAAAPPLTTPAAEAIRDVKVLHPPGEGCGGSPLANASGGAQHSGDDEEDEDDTAHL